MCAVAQFLGSSIVISMVGGVTASPLLPVRNAAHTVIQRQDDFGDYVQQCGTQRENSITVRPLIICCTQGRPLSPSLAESFGGGRFVATFSALPRESVPAAAAPHSPKPQPDFTDHGCSLLRSHHCLCVQTQEAQATTYALFQRRHSQDH